MFVSFSKSLLIKSLLGLFLGLVLLFSQSVLRIPYFDDLADSYFTQSIKKAGVAYATVRVVNATVSIIQESKLQLEPAGVGVSLAVGQVLDPINDMTERLSNILVLAITSLGVQKLSFEITQTLFGSLFGGLLIILSGLLWIKSEKIKVAQTFVLKLSLVVVVARLCLPFSSLANEYLYKNFFESKIVTSKNALELGTKESQALAKVELPKSEGILSALNNTTTFIQNKSVELKNALLYTLSNATDIIENLLSLSFLYIGLFLIQVIILPLLAFLLFYKIFTTLFFKT